MNKNLIDFMADLKEEEVYSLVVEKDEETPESRMSKVSLVHINSFV